MSHDFKYTSRRKFLISSASVLLSSVFLGVAGANKNKIIEKPKRFNNTPKPRLGINLAPVTDWSTEQPFVNLFYTSREWVSQKKNGKWGSGAKLDLDKNGWVKSLPADGYATRIISSAGKGQYPSGDYVVLYDGEGELKLTFAIGKITKQKPGRLVIRVNADSVDAPFALDLIKTNPKNYIRNVRVIASEFESSYEKNPWHPAFLKRWSGIACVRFMDFMKTNGSAVTHWQDRPTPEDAAFTSKGVPLEMLVDLANRLQADAWFCIPHKADDDFVKQFGLYVKKNLKPKLSAWIEYSNELWNGAFEQSRYAGEMGRRLKLSDKPWEAGFRYTAHRSIEIFKLLDAVYAGQEGLVKVLASQAANPTVSKEILSFKDAAKQADVLAIAAYVSFNVSPQEKNGLSEKIVADWNLDKLFNHLNKVSLPETAKWIQNSKKVADQFGVKLVAYEGGQHLTGVLGSENNAKLTKILTEANADKRMGDIYSMNLSDWEKSGGDLFCSFNSMGSWTKWGSWGLLKNNNENPKKSPKFNAVLNWAIKQGQKMNY